MKKLNLIGQKFNKLLAIERIKINKRHHYKCICDCGKIVIIEGSKLKNNHTKSCGCIRKLRDNSHLRLQYGESTKNIVIDYYKRNAKKKNLEFSLTTEELTGFFKDNCFYYGSKPNNTIKIKNCYGDFTYNGIDRLDNRKGYIKNNCVSCCKFCNYKKGNTTFIDFIKWIKKVSKNSKHMIDIAKKKGLKVFVYESC